MTTNRSALRYLILGFVLGAMNGLILLVGTGGNINPFLLAAVCAVIFPAIAFAAVHILRITERRQLENKYNQPAHGEGQ